MSFEIVSYERKKEKVSVKHLGLETAKKVQRFHSSFPIYKKTPLVELNNLAKELKVKNIYVKDESYRFGLNAFKPAQPKVMRYYYHQRVQAGECLIIMNREVTCSSNMSMSFNYGKEKKKKKEWILF